jgi:hypothetical protein
VSVSGIIGNASYFDGAGSYYIKAGHGSSLNATSTLTISAWIKHNASLSGVGSRGVIVQKGNFTGSNGYYLLRMDSNNHYLFGVYQAGWHYPTSASTIPPGSWHMITATWNGSVMRMYMDGVQDVNTLNYSGPITPSSIDLTMGRTADDTGDSTIYFKGSIDDVRIYNRALSAAEISAIYNAAK